MSKYIAQLAPVTILTSVFVSVGWAQNGNLRIDSAHSSASLTLVSSSSATSWNIGIAKVSGTVKLNDDNPIEDILDLNIYPARQGSRLLNPDGSFRHNSFADLSRYTLMSFHSNHAMLNREGKLEFAGELTVTYVKRETNIAWSNAYSGPVYGEPVVRSTTREATFVIETPKRPAMVGRNIGVAEVSALATINRHDFPELRTEWLDAVWPIVVEDEHCEMPQARGNLRDYSGAVCTGTPVEVTPLSQPSQRLGIDYPGPNEVTAPASDKATILVHLRLANPPSGPSGQ